MALVDRVGVQDHWLCASRSRFVPCCCAYRMTAIAPADEQPPQRPIVLTSAMDRSPQYGFDATTLWHSDAPGWAPSTASIALFRVGIFFSARYDLVLRGMIECKRVSGLA